MPRSEAVKLERERRRTLQEQRMWDLLSKPEVLTPIMGVGGAIVLQQLGQHRVLNRDFAGFLLAAWTAYTAAQAGIRDKWALAAITAAATAAYGVSTPVKDGEAVLELHPSTMLGGDGRLFWWDLPLLPD